MEGDRVGINKDPKPTRSPTTTYILPHPTTTRPLSSPYHSLPCPHWNRIKSDSVVGEEGKGIRVPNNPQIIPNLSTIQMLHLLVIWCYLGRSGGGSVGCWEVFYKYPPYPSHIPNPHTRLFPFHNLPLPTAAKKTTEWPGWFMGG